MSSAERTIADQYPDYYSAVKTFIEDLPDPRPQRTLQRMRPEPWTTALAWSRLYDELVAISDPKNTPDRVVFDDLAAEENIVKWIKDDNSGANHLKQHYPILFKSLRVVAPVSYALYLINKGKMRKAISLVGYDKRLLSLLNDTQVDSFYLTLLDLDGQFLTPGRRVDAIMHAAIEKDDLATVKRLLPNITSNVLRLITEAIWYSTEIATYLIENRTVERPITVLETAVMADNAEIVSLITDRHYFEPGKDLTAIIDIAIKGGNVDVVKQLFDGLRRIPTSKEMKGAIETRNSAVIRLLLDLGGTIDDLLLRELISKAAIAIVNVYLEKMNWSVQSVMKVLRYAIDMHSNSIAQSLLEEMIDQLNKAQINELLLLAARSSNIVLLRTLLDFGRLAASEMSFLVDLIDTDLDEEVWRELESDPDIVDMLQFLIDNDVKAELSDEPSHRDSIYSDLDDDEDAYDRNLDEEMHDEERESIAERFSGY